MLGYIPRELAQYLSPLIEKFHLNFEVKELYCIDYILQISESFFLARRIYFQRRSSASRHTRSSFLFF